MMRTLSKLLAFLGHSKSATSRPHAVQPAPIEPSLTDLYKLRGRRFNSLTEDEQGTFGHFRKHARDLGFFVELLESVSGPVVGGFIPETAGYVLVASFADLDALSGRQFDSLSDVQRGIVNYFLERSNELGVFVALIGVPPQSVLNEARTPAEFDAVLKGDHPRIVVTSEAQMLSLPIGRTGALNLLASFKSGAGQSSGGMRN